MPLSLFRNRTVALMTLSLTSVLCLLLTLSFYVARTAPSVSPAPVETAAQRGWGTDTAGFAAIPTFESLQSAWTEDNTQVQAAECTALYTRLLAHEARMRSHPDRQPLIYAPRYHGLGDRLKGLRLCAGLLLC